MVFVHLGDVPQRRTAIHPNHDIVNETLRNSEANSKGRCGAEGIRKAEVRQVPMYRDNHGDASPPNQRPVRTRVVHGLRKPNVVIPSRHGDEVFQSRFGGPSRPIVRRNVVHVTDVYHDGGAPPPSRELA
eukprot:CAMPEP_0117485854 /NCGR_PEP_ID=MMETSP0784-20121206/15177_1 /TAXON_ID=39447 /ORGANISM="" /LENGTH=129 /DNA_ID=CAMNT_0005280449 /DNA_START=176 /DNA_END=565 /DNA_ORIENTATION=-